MSQAVVVDESVSLHVVHRLQKLNYSVQSIAQMVQRGIPDEEVFALAKNPPAILITRDYHFTNSIRFPTDQVRAIVFVDNGNITGLQEAELIAHFFETHAEETYQGRLVILKPSGVRIR